MAYSLLDRLNGLVASSPDEIVAALTVPFPRWRRLGTLRPEEYTENRDHVIVLYNSRKRYYFSGRGTGFLGRTARVMHNWGLSTFISSANRHWFCMSAEVAYPFEHGVHDVEADRNP